MNTETENKTTFGNELNSWMASKGTIPINKCLSLLDVNHVGQVALLLKAINENAQIIFETDTTDENLQNFMKKSKKIHKQDQFIANGEEINALYQSAAKALYQACKKEIAKRNTSTMNNIISNEVPPEDIVQNKEPPKTQVNDVSAEDIIKNNALSKAQAKINEISDQKRRNTIRKEVHDLYVTKAVEIHRYHKEKIIKFNQKKGKSVNEKVVSNHIMKQFILAVKANIERTNWKVHGLLGGTEVTIKTARGEKGKTLPRNVAKIYALCLKAERQDNYFENFNKIALIGKNAAAKQPFFAKRDVQTQAFYNLFTKAYDEKAKLPKPACAA